MTAMGVTLALLLFWEHLEYIYKREFALSNAALLALDAAAAGAAGGGRVPFAPQRNAFPGSPGREGRAHFDGGRALGAQLALCLNNLFETGWDVAGIVSSTRDLPTRARCSMTIFPCTPTTS